MDYIDFIKKNLDFAIKSISSFFVFSYISGFLVWNIYLSKFGYFEYSFLQTRFLSAGIVFSLIYITILFLLKSLERIKKLNWKVDMVGVLYLLILFLPYYSHVFFPRIPQYFGGAVPFAKSIIANEEEIEYFSSLNFIPTENSKGKLPIQTEYLCEIYSNQDVVIIGKSSEGNFRVLILDKRLFKGFQVVPLYMETYVREPLCKSFTQMSFFSFISFL